jgi:hypothetical protein
MEKQRFEDDIRSKLKGHTSNLNPDLWNRLEVGLDTPSSKSVLFIRPKFAAVAATIIILTLVITYLNLQSDILGKSVPHKAISQYKTFNTDSLSEKAAVPAIKSDVLLNLPGHTKNAATKSGVPVNQTFRSMVNFANTILMSSYLPDSSGLNSDNLALMTGKEEAAELFPKLTSDSLTYLQLSSAQGSELPASTSSGTILPEERNKKALKKSSWMALGFASGNYQQMVLTGSPDVGLSRSSSIYYGLNIGRLSLFTGIAMAQQEYDRPSNLATGNPTGLRAVSSEIIGPNSSASDFSATGTYTVNTLKRYLSVPVQAGWFVVDRKIKGMVSLGVISDFFLSSTMSDVSGQLESISIRRGSHPSYAGWVFSGTAGTEWSLGVSDHYQLAISPGIRYAMTPVYKKEISVNGNSYAFDLSVRLRYFFP